MNWTEEKVAELTRLWKEGCPTGEIGKRLGVSKNSVVGKAHRLGLDSRPSPIKKETTDKNQKKENPAQSEEKTTEKAESAKKDGKKKTLLKLIDLHSNSCRWPIGDPKDADFHFCGKETLMGKSYCVEHCLEAYVGIHKNK